MREVQFVVFPLAGWCRPYCTLEWCPRWKMGCSAHQTPPPLPHHSNNGVYRHIYGSDFVDLVFQAYTIGANGWCTYNVSHGHHLRTLSGSSFLPLSYLPFSEFYFLMSPLVMAPLENTPSILLLAVVLCATWGTKVIFPRITFTVRTGYMGWTVLRCLSTTWNIPPKITSHWSYL